MSQGVAALAFNASSSLAINAVQGLPRSSAPSTPEPLRAPSIEPLKVDRVKTGSWLKLRTGGVPSPPTTTTQAAGQRHHSPRLPAEPLSSVATGSITNAWRRGTTRLIAETRISA
ncbi:hypothetical protein VPH35_002667 [Triticum aestivum]